LSPHKKINTLLHGNQISIFPAGKRSTNKTDGSGLKKINATGKRAFFARYSPDGSKIAVITGGWPASNITIMDADGTKPVTIDLELLQKVDKQE